VAAIRNDDIHKWVVATCDLVLGAGSTVALTVFIHPLVLEYVQKTCSPLKGLLIASIGAMATLVISDRTAPQLGPRLDVLI